MANIKKYNLFAKIKPYDLKLSLVFSTDSRVRYMQEFIEDTMRNYRTKYRVGRIEQEKTSSILLPDYKIGEVLDDKDNIIVYSIEYGLTKKTLSDQSSIEDIDKLFIGKKLKRDSRNINRNENLDKKIPKKDEEENDNNNNDDEDDKNDDEEEEEEDDDESEENEKNGKKEKKEKNDEKSEKYEKNEKSEKKEKKIEKNVKKNDNKNEVKKVNNKSNKKKKNDQDSSSNSGDDKSQDLQI